MNGILKERSPIEDGDADRDERVGFAFHEACGACAYSADMTIAHGRGPKRRASSFQISIRSDAESMILVVRATPTDDDKRKETNRKRKPLLEPNERAIPKLKETCTMARIDKGSHTVRATSCHEKWR
jgi:hypothetical protein